MAHDWTPAAAKVVALPVLLPLLARRRAAGETIAFSNGAFDLFHVGHLRSLEQARALADLLVVGVNSDASVRRYKSPDRPLVSQDDRAELVAGLACVDYVVVFDESTAEQIISQVRPDVYVKGADYRSKPFPERPIVEAYGGRVALIELEGGRSTSGLIDEIRRRFGEQASGAAGTPSRE